MKIFETPEHSTSYKSWQKSTNSLGNLPGEEMRTVVNEKSDRIMLACCVALEYSKDKGHTEI
jgi:hypothetical protein